MSSTFKSNQIILLSRILYAISCWKISMIHYILIASIQLHKLMSTKVKGLLKGLRYISNIFDEKEEEFHIGLPTDVKHVAHIGSDDPSANAPSWMTEYKGGKEPSSGNTTQTPEDGEKSNSKGSRVRNHLIPKSRHGSIENESNAPKQRSTRRHQRSSDPSAETSTNESSQRRRRRGSNHGSNHESESASQEMPPSGTKSHRRKSKNSEDGSVKKPSSRRSSKGDSLTDISDFGSGPDSGPLSAQ
ncbi:hypothetical protein VNO78_22273 [Psophocarpus tetragonolobus]|uniref:CRIB domain-containing protein n=1 Tax=Psophocarpus tetragonolobus TaxID=3891 RepID=A0AAN9SCE9_PSOTE